MSKRDEKALAIPKSPSRMRDELAAVQGAGDEALHLTVQVGGATIAVGLDGILAFLTGNGDTVKKAVRRRDVRSRTVVKITDGIELAFEVRQ